MHQGHRRKSRRRSIFHSTKVPALCFVVLPWILPCIHNPSRSNNAQWKCTRKRYRMLVCSSSILPSLSQSSAALHKPPGRYVWCDETVPHLQSSLSSLSSSSLFPSFVLSRHHHPVIAIFVFTFVLRIIFLVTSLITLSRDQTSSLLHP